MINNTIHLNEINSPKQTINARVEIHKGSTLERVCTCADILSDFTVERAGEHKFFGYGICQKAQVKLIDVNRDLRVTKENSIEVTFGVGGNVVYPFPVFYVTEAPARDETSNMLSITAYDALYKAAEFTVADLTELPETYTLELFVALCAAKLGLPFSIDVSDDAFDIEYSRANFSGNESLRAALNAVAEVTQTIYYINKDWQLTFKRLNTADAVATIGKNQYITLSTDGEQTLTNITHTTELEDSVTTVGEGSGATQFIRDNPFLSLNDNIGELLDKALTIVGGLSIHQYECSWLGNYLIELGDQIKFVAEDDSTITTYLLDDVITYDGTFMQQSRWQFDGDDVESAANPTSLGEALNKTYARVDKAEQNISLVAQSNDANSNAISRLQVTTNDITAIVEKTESEIKGVNEEISTLRTEIAQTAEYIKIEIKEEIANEGVTAESVKVSKGFTFDNNGLTIETSDSEIKTTVTEDGMKITKHDETLLIADNKGVSATDLRASTYLEIGGNSRFQNYTRSDGVVKTACFWIGQ